ncbi:MAG: prepilin-type N-terminal cleavage/methylation domain-containing protein [Cyanobacteria bacterium P01_D01_bin.1]
MKAVCQIKDRREEGFTLIELLVVVVIVGVLGAIAAPGWLGFFTRQKMNAVNSDLASVIKDAQSDAIQQRSRRQVTFSAVGSTPSVTVSSLGVDGVDLYTTELGTDSENLQLATFERVSGAWTVASTPQITFDHNGNVSSTNGPPYIVEVQPQDSNFSIPSRCVIITTLLGGIKVENGNACNNFSPD